MSLSLTGTFSMDPYSAYYHWNSLAYIVGFVLFLVIVVPANYKGKPPFFVKYGTKPKAKTPPRVVDINEKRARDKQAKAKEWQ